jgi:hypothetical protein
MKRLVELKINCGESRENVILALVDEGYVVKLEKRDNEGLLATEDFPGGQGADGFYIIVYEGD